MWDDDIYVYSVATANGKCRWHRPATNRLLPPIGAVCRVPPLLSPIGAVCRRYCHRSVPCAAAIVTDRCRVPPLCGYCHRSVPCARHHRGSMLCAATIWLLPLSIVKRASSCMRGSCQWLGTIFPYCRSCTEPGDTCPVVIQDHVIFCSFALAKSIHWRV